MLLEHSRTLSYSPRIILYKRWKGDSVCSPSGGCQRCQFFLPKTCAVPGNGRRADATVRFKFFYVNMVPSGTFVIGTVSCTLHIKDHKLLFLDVSDFAELIMYTQKVQLSHCSGCFLFGVNLFHCCSVVHKTGRINAARSRRLVCIVDFCRRALKTKIWQAEK